MTIVVLPDGRKARFPNDMPREQIKAYIDGKQQHQTMQEQRNMTNVPEWQRRIADNMVREGRNDLTFGEKAEVIGRGLVSGLSDLGGRVLNGATFGASDWATRKAGLDPTKGINEMIDNAKSDREAGIIGLLSTGTEMAGGFPTGGGLYKGVAKGLTAIPKGGNVAKYFAPAVSGAITGGSYGGFQGDSLEAAKRGAIRGAVIGQAFDFAGRGLNKALSAAGKIKGVERGFENAVKSDKGSGVLNRGIKESKDIAKQVYGQAPAAKQQINLKMAYTMDDAVKNAGGASKTPQSVVAEAKKAYAEFLDANKGKQFVQGKPDFSSIKTVLVDKNGKPSHFYHGSPYKFDKFSQKNKDYNFSYSKDFAKNYSDNKSFEQGLDRETNIYDVFLKSKKPFNFENEADIQNLSKIIGNKEIRTFGDVYKKEEFLNNIRGAYKKAAVSKEDFLNAKVGDSFDASNWKLNGPMKSEPILYKNNDYFIIATPRGGYSHINTPEAIKQLDTVSKNSKNFDFKGDSRKFSRIELKKVYNPDSAKLMTDADNWAYIEETDIGGESLSSLLKKNGYDAIFKREDGARNISVFSPKNIIMAKDVIGNPKPSDLGLNNQLSINQKAALNKAWQEGANMLKPGEKIGSVKHIDYMERSLNSQINSSMQANPNGVGMVSSNKTPELMELKRLLRDTMSKSGVEGINEQYTQAKRIEDAYNLGLNYKANSVKTRNLGFGSQDEKLAFTEGLFERAKMNPSNTNVSKDILANQDVLRDVLPKQSFESLVKQARTNSLSYERINSMENAAARKIGAAEPIGQSTGLLREWLDSTLAPIGAVADMARRAATANSSVKASRYLLNPEMRMGRPLYDAIQQYLPTSTVILNESKTKRKENK